MKFRLETMKRKDHITQNLVGVISRPVFISIIQQLNFQQCRRNVK